MAGELGLGVKDLERRFAASLLRSGLSMEEAKGMAQILARDFHRDFTGKRLTIRIERPFFRTLLPEDRRRIFLKWWTERTPDHELCTEEKISLPTLRRIQAQGRKKNWDRI
jgi:hypothetical protein